MQAAVVGWDDAIERMGAAMLRTGSAV
eukprot:SAG11_NODE_33632_length_276_cov_0.587571_1_plen_26_part_01